MIPIHILGSGAMACLWASYFNTNHNINFIRRHANENVFRFTLKPQDRLIEGKSFTANNLNEPITHLIVATKAFDAKSAIQSVEHRLTPNTQILLLQNGMGSQQEIAQAFKQYAVYACSSTEGAYKIDAHTLMHAGKGVNNIGAMTKKAKEDKLTQWLPAEHFKWHENIEPILWRKLIVNGAINPLTLLYQCKNGELINQPSLQIHMKKICLELDQLLSKLPFKMSPAFEIATQVCQQTANNYSSMYQDGKYSHPTEIDFITGYLVNKCIEMSVDCPENEKILKKVKQLNLGP